MAFSAVVFGGLLGVVSTALIVALCACRAAKTIPADRIALEDAYAAACLGLSDGPLPLPRPLAAKPRTGFSASLESHGFMNY